MGSISRKKDFRLGDTVRKLHDDKLFHDVEIVVSADDATSLEIDVKSEAVFVGAHRLILAAGSEFFMKYFTENDTAETCRIPMLDVKNVDFKYLLDFLYNGSVVLPEEKTETFMTLAKRLLVHGLSDEDRAEANVSSTSNGASNSPLKRKIKMENPGAKKVKVEPTDTDDDGNENMATEDWDVDDKKDEGSGSDLPLVESVAQDPTVVVVKTLSPVSACVTTVQAVGGVVKLADSRGVCAACGRVFNDASNARKHYERMHRAKIDIGCDVCGKRFDNRITWASHLRQAHSVTQKMLKQQCQVQQMLAT